MIEITTKLSCKTHVVRVPNIGQQTVYSDGSRGVPWVPWNPTFEGLPSQILGKSACANVIMYTMAHTNHSGIP